MTLPLSSLHPAPLRASSRLTSPGRVSSITWRRQATQGPEFTIVGYGGEIRDGAVYIAGYRKTARASFIGLTDMWVALTQTTDLLPRNGALCLGDSGSPQFLGGSNVQVSVYHGGALDCYGTGYAQRLDTPAEQAFLAPYLPTR